MLSGAGSKVGDEVGCAHHCFIVLDDNDCITQVFQTKECVDQPVVVMGMQSHGGLVAHVEHPGESGTDLSSQAHPLGLAAGQCSGGAVHGHVIQADTLQEFDSAFDLFQDLVGDGLLAGGQYIFLMRAGSVGVDVSDPLSRLSDVLGADVHYSQATDFHRQGFRAQPFTVA